MMKHYGFSAAEAIGWMRICRPGSVIGPQQQYLEQMESVMHQEGLALRQQVPVCFATGDMLRAYLRSSSSETIDHISTCVTD